jgi:hypothetical protein
MKRQNREKISDIKEDIIKFKLMKESTWDRVTSSMATSDSSFHDEILIKEEMIAKA